MSDVFSRLNSGSASLAGTLKSDAMFFSVRQVSWLTDSSALVTAKYVYGQVFLFVYFYFNPHLRICLLALGR